jgi:trans-aconitate methyltransferase
VNRRARGAAAHLGIDLLEYDARILTFIPDYSKLLDAAGSALAALAPSRTPIVVDLGIGTGALAAACLARVPGARIIGLDEDAAMLDSARARLGRRLHATGNGSFERATLPRCDAAVASLSLHHVPTPARRARLFRRLRAALRLGGVLVSADCYPASNPRLQRLDRLAWTAHLERSYTPAIARRYLRVWAREDHFATLGEETDALRRAGFAVDVRFRSGAFAVIAAAR